MGVVYSDGNNWLAFFNDAQQRYFFQYEGDGRIGYATSIGACEKFVIARNPNTRYVKCGQDSSVRAYQSYPGMEYTDAKLALRNSCPTYRCNNNPSKQADGCSFPGIISDLFGGSWGFFSPACYNHDACFINGNSYNNWMSFAIHEMVNNQISAII